VGVGETGLRAWYPARNLVSEDGERTVERRFHSPYRRWISGFAFEIALFVGFSIVLMAFALVAAWMRG
jgi:hypothetical protein